MSLRFCSRCRADVEDVGGYCLLGHTFPKDTSDPISDLRAEVDKAFEQIKIDIPVRSLASPFKTAAPAHAAAPAPALNAASSPGTTGTAADAYDELRASDEHLVEEMAQSRRDYWSQLRDEDDATIARDDPILSFSPSPRMEWGPSKSRRRKRS